MDDDLIVYLAFQAGGSAQVYKNGDRSTFDIRVTRWGGTAEVSRDELLALGEELVRIASRGQVGETKEDAA
jgi:hypothetical protein